MAVMIVVAQLVKEHITDSNYNINVYIHYLDVSGVGVNYILGLQKFFKIIVSTKESMVQVHLLSNHRT